MRTKKDKEKENESAADAGTAPSASSSSGRRKKNSSSSGSGDAGKKIKKQIILNCEELETRSALLCDGRLEEYALERPSDEIVSGSIYLGRIVRLEPSLEAAFVDIGAEKNAFLRSEERRVGKEC